MADWRQYLAGAGVLALTAGGLPAQVVEPAPEVRVPFVLQPLPPVLQPLPPEIIIINPPLPQVSGVTGTVILPIVNEGFAHDQDVKGALKPLVEALRSQVFTEREDASRAMLRLPPARLDEVVKALEQETDAEAIERLTQAAAHLYLKPRTLLKSRVSLLGLKYKMDPVKLAPQDKDLTMTVMVTELQPGFPAMQALRNGDRIVAMEGVGFPPDIPELDNTYFPMRVAGLTAGAVVRMTVLREGKVIELGVQVAGLPEGTGDAATMVQLRASALGAFMKTLKTGDKSQVMWMGPAEPQRAMLITPAPVWDDEILIPAPNGAENPRN